MYSTVPALSIFFMFISCLVGFAIPLVLCVWFRKKNNAEIAPFFIGCIVFLVCVMFLESAFHRQFLNSSFGTVIVDNPLYYAVYGGLCAAVFEEFGRLIAYKTLMKPYMGKDENALMYGAGHGGLESMMLLGLTMINNIAYSMTINKGNLEELTGSMSPETLASFNDLVNQMCTTPSWQYLMGAVERFPAVALQISLSVLVWMAVTRKKQWFLFPLAILIHFVVDAVTLILSQSGAGVIAIEAAIIGIAVVVVLLTRKIWKMNR